VYLTALGAKGTVKATKERIGLDELFVLEDSHPQVKLKAWNGRRVSVRAGVEVSANQDDHTDAEYFQLEINQATKLVCPCRVCVGVGSCCAVGCPHTQEPDLVCC
jgi:fascin 1/2